MKRTEQLAFRLREIISNGTWIANTNYKDQLDPLNWEIATKQFQSLNTIAILTQHVHYYINGIKNVFEGGNLEIRDKYSFDFLPIESEIEWKMCLIKLYDDSEKLAYFIEHFPDEKLDQSFVDDKYGTWQRNIEGLIEHCYYHLGQIVLIKKILLNDL